MKTIKNSKPRQTINKCIEWHIAKTVYGMEAVSKIVRIGGPHHPANLPLLGIEDAWKGYRPEGGK